MVLRQLSVRVRLWGLGMVCLALLGLIASGSYVAHASLHDMLDDLRLRHRPMSVVAGDLRASTLHLRRLEKDLLLNIDQPEAVEDFWTQWQEAYKHATGELQVLQALAIAPEDQPVITQLKGGLQTYADAVHELHARLNSPGPTGLHDAASANAAIAPHEDHIRSVDTKLQAFVGTVTKRVSMRQQELDRGTAAFELKVSLLVALAFAVGAVLFSAIGRSITTPHHKTLAVLYRIRAGDRTARIHDTGADEIHAIAAALDETLDQVLAAEEEVLRRAVAMREVLNVVDEAMVLIHRDGTVSQERSAAFDRWFGAEQPMETLTDVVTRISPDLVDAVVSAWARQQELPAYEFVSQLPATAIRGRRQYKLRWQPLLAGPSDGGAERQLRACLLLISDVTDEVIHRQALVAERVRAENALAARSEFLANMSHEIRTPMNGVLGMAELLRDEVEGEEGRERLATLLRCGEHLLTLINDILDLSKLESEKLVLDPRPFSPARCIHEAVALFSESAASKQVTLSAQCPKPHHHVVADESRYRQVLYNLVNNAIKFTQRGEVRIELDVVATPEGSASVDPSDRHYCNVITRVIDTGIGIPQEKLSAIFQPFEQADSSTARRFGGSGLGLSISSKLAHLFGGGLEVASQEGTGSTFTLSFPSELADAKETAAIGATSVAALPLPTRVIVAEDNLVNRKVVDGLLRRIGINAKLVNDGSQLLEALAENQYEVVLLDCHMPIVDGFEAARHIIRDFPARPYIIALTASALAEERQRCFSAGMDDFVSKPINPEELKAALARAIEFDSKRPAHSA